MRQLVQSISDGTVELVELPDPVPGPREVLVRTSWSLISAGTEQALARTARKGLVGKALDRPERARQVVDKAAREGIAPTIATVRARLDDLTTPGYSSAGVVVDVGSEVEGFRRGDRVGCVGANAACHVELAVVPAPLCTRLPEGTDERFGAFGGLGAIAAHGVRLAGVEPGSIVVVIGLGLVGQLAAQLVTAAGARVVAVDKVAARVDLAVSLGASAGAAPEEAERAALRASSGAGADAIVVAAASRDGSPLQMAARAARDRAVISLVGDVRLDVERDLFYRKELQLRVSRSYGPGRYDPLYERQGVDYPIGYVRWTEGRLIDYFHQEVAAGRIRLEPLITHEIEFAEAPTAYAALEDPGRLAILLRYPSPGAELPTPPPKLRATISRAETRRDGRPRVALIGPGLFARSTLFPLLAQQDVDLVAVAGGRGVSGLSAARRFGIPCVASSAAVLDDPNVDVVIVATRHDSHAPLVADALEAGKAVFVEKPLAVDQAGLQRVAALMRQGGRLVVDFNRRYSPMVQEAISMLAGRVEPLHVICRVNAGMLPRGHWLRDPQQGGGRLVGEACHFVDLCSALVSAKPESVAVAGLPPAGSTLPNDSFVLTLRYTDGSLANISYISTGSRYMPKERVELLGGGRSLVIDDFRRLLCYDRRLRRPRPARIQNKGHGSLMAAAFRFFRSEGPPPIPYDELIDTTRLCLLAQAQLRHGRQEFAQL